MSASSSQALEYVEQLTGIEHKKLYQKPSTVLAIFRCMLPHLAKTIVMAMLYMPGTLPAADLDVWIRPGAQADKDRALAVLQGLHIVAAELDDARTRVLRLEATFSRSLKQALTGSGDHRSFGAPSSTPDPDKKSVEWLDNFARTQWEAILYYMVGSTGAGTALKAGSDISPGTKSLLSIGGFVTAKGNSAKITQTGFTFLLEEVNAQIWTLLIVYLRNAENINMNPVEVLSFLFMLGSLELGQDYSTANLTPTQREMLHDLKDFGIIYRVSKDSPRFYPTRLATTLTSDAGALTNSSIGGGTGSKAASSISNTLSTPTAPQGKGYIIIETNYRLYAYTDSVLQISVLNLFAKLKTRYPNLVAGKLTKDSVQRAISYGITADQIISYLQSHAHPQMTKSNPILPPTVVDQIRLWQIEGDRMKATAGFLFKDFKDQNEYEDAMQYATALGVLTWKNDARRVFFVNKLEQMKNYMKSKGPAGGQAPAAASKPKA